jgi:DNA-binding protein H-NS
MTTLTQLLAQKAALEVQIEAVRKAEKADAIVKVKALIAEYGLTQQFVFGGAKRGRKARVSVAPNNIDTFDILAWSGRNNAVVSYKHVKP